MADIFLSYSRQDQITARRFAEALEQAGFSVWWDQTLRSGEAYDEVTERALKSAKAVVVLWSKASVASRWVRAEATIADRAGTLVPAMIEPCERPVMFELRQTADLSEWKGNPQDQSWITFLGDLRAATGGSGLPTSRPAPDSIPKPVARSAWKLAAALAAIVIVGAGGWAFWQKFHGPELRPAGEQTLAVLPFVNLSSDPQQEYFVDGLTEELLNSLAGLTGLRVTGRTSAFYFKGRNEDMKVIGEKLGVEYLLEGSVRKDGDQLRIVAQLVKSKDSFHLWSQTYDRPLKDAFKVQEEIARSVAGALQISLGVGEIGRAPLMTRDVEAYQAFAEARALTSDTPEIASRRMERLQFAVERDPKFTLAWMQLSGMYRSMSNFGDANSAHAGEMLKKADEAQAQALRSIPDPRIVQAFGEGVVFQRGEWKANELNMPKQRALVEEFKLQALVGPSLDLYHVAEDKPEGPIEQMERERLRDPLNQRISINLALAYAVAGRMKDSIAEDRRGRTISASPVQNMSAVFTAKAFGEPAILEEAWKAYVATPGVEEFVPRLYELRAKPAEALAELERHGPVPSLWAAYFGDYGRALERLKAENVPDRRFAVAYTIWRPIMAPVRKLPGFKDLVRDLGLVDYWREFGWGQHCKPVDATDFTCT